MSSVYKNIVTLQGWCFLSVTITPSKFQGCGEVLKESILKFKVLNEMSTGNLYQDQAEITYPFFWYMEPHLIYAVMADITCVLPQ